jgi:hypothetical protein
LRLKTGQLILVAVLLFLDLDVLKMFLHQSCMKKRGKKFDKGTPPKTLDPN